MDGFLATQRSVGVGATSEVPEPMTDIELINSLRAIADHPFDVVPLYIDVSVECSAAADRIEKLGEQLTEAIAFWERHRATLDTIKAALDTYDKDPHPADPHILFAFVEAVARAIRR